MSKKLANFATHEVLNSEVLKGGRGPRLPQWSDYGRPQWSNYVCKGCKPDNKDR